MTELEALGLLNQFRFTDLDKIKELGKFLNSPEAAGIVAQLDKAKQTPDQVRDQIDNDLELKKYKINRKSNAVDELGFLRDTMIGGPMELVRKAAFAALGEAPTAIGNIVGGHYDSNAERRMVGGQTEGQRRAWGISPADAAKQRYAAQEKRKANTARQVGQSVGNVFKAVAGARNAADTAARMQMAAGQGNPMSYGGFLALNRMLKMSE